MTRLATHPNGNGQRVTKKQQQDNQEPSPNGVLAFALKAVDAVCKAALPTEVAEAIAKAFRKAADEIVPRVGEIKKHLRCPSCWDGLGGSAGRRKWSRQISGPLQQRCYVCNQCGTEWVVEVRSEENDGVLFTQTRVAEVREQIP